MRLVGLGIHNYHAAYNQLPIATGGTTGGSNSATSNGGRLSGIVGVTPFMEEQVLWRLISNAYTSPSTGRTFPPMGPVPWFDATEYEPWGKRPGAFQCPSQPDPNATPRPENPASQVVYTLDRLVEEPRGIGVMTN